MAHARIMSLGLLALSFGALGIVHAVSTAARAQDSTRLALPAAMKVPAEKSRNARPGTV